MNMEVNGTVIQVRLCENSSGEAVKEFRDKSRRCSYERSISFRILINFPAGLENN
jgi:hypothetical protein